MQSKSADNVKHYPCHWHVIHSTAFSLNLTLSLLPATEPVWSRKHTHHRANSHWKHSSSISWIGWLGDRINDRIIQLWQEHHKGTHLSLGPSVHCHSVSSQTLNSLAQYWEGPRQKECHLLISAPNEVTGRSPQCIRWCLLGEQQPPKGKWWLWTFQSHVCWQSLVPLVIQNYRKAIRNCSVLHVFQNYVLIASMCRKPWAGFPREYQAGNLKMSALSQLRKATCLLKVRLSNITRPQSSAPWYNAELSEWNKS